MTNSAQARSARRDFERPSSRRAPQITHSRVRDAVCNPCGERPTLLVVEEQALRQAFALGKRTWPSIDIDFDTFRTHCERVLGSAAGSGLAEASPPWDWTRFGAELFLCCACAQADEEAMRVLETETLPQVVKAISRIDADPEFIEEALQTLRSLLRMIEEKTRLVQLLDDYINGAGLTVVIGSEHPSPDLRSFSIVTATYNDRRGTGAVGVIGPTRMRYSRAIDAVESVTRAMNRLAGRNDA